MRCSLESKVVNSTREITAFACTCISFEQWSFTRSHVFQFKKDEVPLCRFKLDEAFAFFLTFPKAARDKS